jgi:hypothetical protein
MLDWLAEFKRPLQLKLLVVCRLLLRLRVIIAAAICESAVDATGRSLHYRTPGTQAIRRSAETLEPRQLGTLLSKAGSPLG